MGDPDLFCARKVVRDLLWAATSPHMVSGALYPVLPASMGPEALRSARVREWLAALDADPQPLLSFLSGASSPLSTLFACAHMSTLTARSVISTAVPASGKLALGVYFSALLEFWLRHCPAFRVERLATGTQIVSASNQTVGQLKFLFRCSMEHEGTTDMHVESSVKFFLLHPQSRPQVASHEATDAGSLQDQSARYPLEQFVGPHLGENLAWRVQEVARKLDMCRGDAVRAWLRARYSEVVSSHIVLRGYLFYPLRLFASTSSVTRGHDWRHHRNTTTRSDRDGNVKGVGELPPSHAAVASGHLSGWWTTDVEAQLPAKVAANALAQCGESRFLVLPKLHWLAPVIATEDAQSGSVAVSGELALEADRVHAMSLNELLAFSRTHFDQLAAAPPEATARGAVVMPLLVAEIVRCRPVDQEYSAAVVRWKELSRGFLLDPRCWDPVPLCSQAVRFRKTSQRADSSALGSSRVEREYAGRSEWRKDGFVKPTEQELALRRENRPRLFPEPASVSPVDLVARVAAAIADEEPGVTHASLKTAIKEVLLCRVEADEDSEFVWRALSALILEMPSLDGERSSKQTQRVGHIVVDALESISADLTFVQYVKYEPGIRLLFQIAADRRRWDFFNLVLRGLQLARVDGMKEPPTLKPRAELDAIIESLLAQEQCRWNAVAVEMLRVLPGSADLESTTLYRLVDQADWPNAERLAATTRDPVLFQAMLEQLASRDMKKAIKRLRKANCACAQAADVSSSQEFCRSTRGGGPNVVPAIDHAQNRQLAGFNLALEHWEYVRSPAQLQDLVAYLSSMERAVQEQSSSHGGCAKEAVVGLDCEWRPQFLATAWRPSTADGGEGEAANVGVSLYQLAVGSRVFVVDVQLLGVAAAAPLQVMWRPSSPFLLFGFCVSSDLKRLAQSFPELMAAKTLELKRLAALRQVPVDKWGLSRLYRACFGQVVSKEQQCSDWGNRPLTPSQLAYAAMDALAVRNVALHLLADLTLTGDQLRELTGHKPAWRPGLTTLGKPHVRAALWAMGLEDMVSFHTISKDESGQSPRQEAGLVVKTIAVVVRGKAAAEVPRYAAVVLQLDRVMDMQALADSVGASSPLEVSLADQQTLLRAFGYSRGCVGPVGLRQQAAVQVIVDSRLERERRLLCGAGALDEVFSIAPDVLIASVGATTAAISASVC